MYSEIQNGLLAAGLISPEPPNSILAAAHDYIQRGFYVFPVHLPINGGCTCEHWHRTREIGAQPDYVCQSPGKCPRCKWMEASSIDPAKIEEWFIHPWRDLDRDGRPPRIPRPPNIGIDCGKSGILVLDADSYKSAYGPIEDWLLPADLDTLTIQTPRGGQHLYYLNPNGYGNGHELPAGIDIRGAGGYVLAPPSIGANGNEYSIINNAPIAPIPAQLCALLPPAQPHRIGTDARMTIVPTTHDIDVARAALAHLSDARRQSGHYDDWVSVGMALSALGADGLALWEEWSVGGTGYQPGICAAKWSSFVPGAGIGLGSLIAWARTDTPGWSQPNLLNLINAPTAIPPAIFANGQPQSATTAPTPPPAPDAPILLSTQIEADLHAWGYRPWLNDMDDSLWNGEARMDDPTIATIRVTARDAGYGRKNNAKTLPALEDCLVALAAKNRRHPMREWLNSLQWDGGDWIGELANYFPEKNSPIIAYPDGSQRSYFYAFFYRWAIGAVAKQMGDKDALGSNFALVLAGNQDIGKSYFARWLCPPSEFFVEKTIVPDNKDCSILRTNTFIWEIMELGATTRHRDVEAIKAFLTSSASERAPYGRFSINKMSVASYIGTVNPDGVGFLGDTTGNRRFAICELEKIDQSYTQIDPTQIWAQAMQIWRANPTAYKMTAEEKAARHQSTVAHVDADLMADYIRSVFIVDATRQDWRLSSSRILEALREYGGLSRGGDKTQGRDLAKSLQTQWGISGKRSNGATYYHGLRARNDALATAMNATIAQMAMDEMDI